MCRMLLLLQLVLLVLLVLARHAFPARRTAMLCDALAADTTSDAVCTAFSKTSACLREM